jgi:hypothetical protein
VSGDPPARLAELIAQVTQTLRGGDDEVARAQAAAQVDQLRELVAQADRARPAGSQLPFDLAQVQAMLRQFADWLRAPTHANEADAEQAIASLRAALGPLVPWDPAPSDAADRERYRRDARSAIDDYFREHPITPVKPPKIGD